MPRGVPLRGTLAPVARELRSKGLRLREGAEHWGWMVRTDNGVECLAGTPADRTAALMCLIHALDPEEGAGRR
jgi:hypothetical protein